MPVTGRRRAAAPATATWPRTGARSALIRHVAGMMPWGPLLAGCLAGIGVTAALRALAGPAETPAALGVGIRASFIPVMAGLAFLLSDPHRLLTVALPARTWLTPAVRFILALPVLILTGALQLWLASRTLAADLRFSGQPPATLPWLALAAELTAWCALALALAAGFQRTRWQDLAGLTAAITGPALVGALALPPAHLLPATMTGLTSAQHRQWTTAWQFWTAAAAACALTAARAVGDTWHRPVLTRRTSHRCGRHAAAARTPPDGGARRSLP
jgi:hypothetical protein